jgi:hypothetical protein
MVPSPAGATDNSPPHWREPRRATIGGFECRGPLYKTIAQNDTPLDRVSLRRSKTATCFIRERRQRPSEVDKASFVPPLKGAPLIFSHVYPALPCWANALAKSGARAFRPFHGLFCGVR